MEIQQKYNMLSSESKASILTAGLIGEQYIGITPGFYDEDMGTTYLKDGDRINDTGSAIVLEDLIGKFLYSVNNVCKHFFVAYFDVWKHFIRHGVRQVSVPTVEHVAVLSFLIIIFRIIKIKALFFAAKS